MATFVVVAEGDAIVRNTLQAHLREAGYEVLTATDAEMVIMLLLVTTTPLVVLLDAELPGLAGHNPLETVRQVDGSAEGRRRVYILLTQGAENPLAGLDGATPVLAEPFSVEVLLEAVARAADQLGSDQTSYSA